MSGNVINPLPHDITSSIKPIRFIPNFGIKQHVAENAEYQVHHLIDQVEVAPSTHVAWTSLV